MKSVFNFFGELVKIVIIALVIVLPVRYFLVQPFFVSGESMEPTFANREYLLIDEISYRLNNPTRGDVVVFHPPLNPAEYYIKRVIGLPGERLVSDGSAIKVYVPNAPAGRVLDEVSYLGKGLNATGGFDVTLKPNEFFMLGDNRGSSYDSRRWGPIVRNAIVGKVWLVVWPFPKAQAFSSPIYP